MTLQTEVRRFADGRLMLVVNFSESSNFWIHPNKKCSYVPTKLEIRHIEEVLDAIDTYNTDKNRAHLNSKVKEKSVVTNR